MIINPWSLFSLILLFLFLEGHAFAQEKDKVELRFVTIPIPAYVQNNEKGQFLNLTRDLLKDSDFTPVFEVLPPKRARLTFKNGHWDGFFPHLPVDKLNTLVSEPFYYKKDFIFSMKAIDRVPQKGRICLTNGYPYDFDKIPKGLTQVNAHSDEACLKMMTLGRVDYFLCELQTGLISTRSLGLKNFHIYQKAISALPVSFTFQNNEKGRKALEQINSALGEMRSNGKLKTYFNSYLEESERTLGSRILPTEPLKD